MPRPRRKLTNSWKMRLESGTIFANEVVLCTAICAKEGLMLATRYRLQRNPFFQFHPLHTLFSLVGTLILFGLLVWFLAVPAK